MTVNKETLKQILKSCGAIVFTTLVFVVLFGLIFVSFGINTISPTFFLELGIIVILTVTIRKFWYDSTEYKRLSQPDLKQARQDYFDLYDAKIKDTNSLEKYLVILNEENRQHYVMMKMGKRTADTLAEKNKMICFFHPSFKNLNKEEIGKLRYKKLIDKYTKQSFKIKDITSTDLMSLSDINTLYDSKNHAKIKKSTYQILSVVSTVCCTTGIALLGFKEIMLNWENVFRYITYAFSILSTIVITVNRAWRITEKETLDWYERLKLIIDKYSTYIDTKKEEQNVGNSENVSGL